MMLLLSAHGFTLAPRLSVRTSTPARAISMLEGRPNFATVHGQGCRYLHGARLAEAMPPIELDVSTPFVSVPTATLIAEQTDMTASDFDWKEWSELGKPKPPPGSAAGAGRTRIGGEGGQAAGEGGRSKGRRGGRRGAQTRAREGGAPKEAAQGARRHAHCAQSLSRANRGGRRRRPRPRRGGQAAMAAAYANELAKADRRAGRGGGGGADAKAETALATRSAPPSASSCSRRGRDEGAAARRRRRRRSSARVRALLDGGGVTLADVDALLRWIEQRDSHLDFHTAPRARESRPNANCSECRAAAAASASSPRRARAAAAELAADAADAAGWTSVTMEA